MGQNAYLESTFLSPSDKLTNALRVQRFCLLLPHFRATSQANGQSCSTFPDPGDLIFMASITFNGNLYDLLTDLEEVLGIGVTYGAFGTGSVIIGSSFLRGAKIEGTGLNTPSSGPHFLTGTVEGFVLTHGSIPDITRPLQIEDVLEISGVSIDGAALYDLASRTSSGSQGALQVDSLSAGLNAQHWTVNLGDGADLAAPTELLPFSGNDRLDGLGGNDTLNGGNGLDTLSGGDGDDFLYGGASPMDLRDVIYGGNGADHVDGGYGNDLLYGGNGNDTILGGAGADELIGQAGNDVINGSAFSDLVFGGDGNDFVNGGFGHDRINGGQGADKFFHTGELGHGSDWVQDYSSSEGDVLLFGNSSASGSDFQVNFAHTESAAGERAGNDDIREAFVIYKPTDQIIWALVDGEGQSSINLQLGGETFDLLA